MLRNPIMLNCYVYDEDELEAAKADIDLPIDFDHGPTERRWFYIVSSLHPHEDNPFATVVCGPGFGPVVVKEDYEAIVNMINEAR